MRGNAQELLQALDRQTRPVSVHALRQPLGIGKANAHGAIRALVGRGLAARPRYGQYRITGRGRTFLAEGRVVNRGRREDSPHSVRTDTVRARTWRAARMMRRVTVKELAQLVARPDERDPRGSIQRYVTALERAGYLRRLPGPRNAARHWMLIRNTGPRAPMVIKRETAVYDPNTEDTHELRRPA